MEKNMECFTPLGTPPNDQMSENCDEVKYCFYCGKVPVNPVKLNCKHKCCAECLKEYTKTEKNCPICDTPLPFVIQKADEAEIEGKLEEEPTNEKETNNENEPKYPEIEKAEEIFDFEDRQRKYDEDTNIPGPIKVFAINDEPQKNEENAKNNERPQIRVIPIDEKDANNNPTIGERPQIIDTPIIEQNNECTKYNKYNNKL